jgi:serine protease Do
MGIGTDFIRFFDKNNLIIVEKNKKRLKTVLDFITEYPQYDDFVKLTSCIKKLESSGEIASLGYAAVIPQPLKQRFTAITERNIEYGVYDFLAGGFTSIRKYFTQSVLPIEVTLPDGSLDIGTGFLFGEGGKPWIATARHVIENKNKVNIVGIDPRTWVGSIFVPKDESNDIAFISFNENPVPGQPAFLLDDSEVLDEVLTLGYPPIAGFDCFQVAEIASINSKIKSSVGNIIGEAFSFLEGRDLMLVNCKVKGGNSGGPLINKYGYVVGMFIQIPLDPQDSTKLDSLGYGIAIPTNEIVKFIEIIRSGIDFTRLNRYNLPNGCFITNPAVINLILLFSDKHVLPITQRCIEPLRSSLIVTL